MPIELSFRPSELSKPKFQELDFKVMGVAYDIQNRYGNQLDEKIYQDELTHRLEAAGFPAHSEVGVTLQYGPFRRHYSCDLVVNDSLIIECKATSDLVNAHKRQLLHYLFLTEVRYGRLINFRPSLVQKWIMSNSVPLLERRHPNFVFDGWEKNRQNERLSSFIQALISDWGTGLLRGSYLSATLEHLKGVVYSKSIPLLNGERFIGRKEVEVIGNDSALLLTTYSGDVVKRKTNFLRLLDLTSLESLHWINIDLHTVTFCRIKS